MQYWVDPHDTRPTSLSECRGDSFQEADYYDRQDDEMMRLIRGLYESSATGEGNVQQQASRPAIRAPRKRFYLEDENHVRIYLYPKQTFWYKLYVVCPNLDSPKFQKKFRRRFRLPYGSYKQLLQAVVAAEDDDGIPFFRAWMSFDATGKPSSPIELLLLGSLRYLGRGFTFDDIEEATCISEETHRRFFAVFIKFGRAVLYPKWVRLPKTALEADNHMHEMCTAGFHGCVGSSDATHVLLERVSHRQQQSHSSFKMTGCARSYNLTVNHRRQILSTTSGHPCRWNDKTIQLFDRFMNAINNGEILQDVEFELLEEREGEVVPVKYKGVWLMVDNGYLKWATTMPPMKRSLDLKEIRWSQWLESMRKDVECTFGILKGRWRLLKAGIRVHGVTKADDIWHTCCALHNFLLEVDGLDKRWQNGVHTSYWEGEAGEFDSDDVALVARIGQPDAIRRLLNPALRRGYDTSAMGAGDDLDMDYDINSQGNFEQDQTGPNSPDQLSVRIVKDLSQPYFRSKLVDHFDILWRQGKIVWPSRHKAKKPTYP